MKQKRLTIAAALGLGTILAALWLLGRPVEPSHAADLCVGSYASIQDAIDNAGDGDTVRVPTGLYTENLVITASITLQGGWNSGCSSRATTDPAQTVIDGNAAGSVVSINQGAPTLESLTLTGGRSNKGGGVFVDDGASTTLDNVVVSGNVVSTTISEWTLGAGVYVGRWGTITLSHTDIVSNTAYAYPGLIALGGGLYVDVGSSVNLTVTRIMSNVNASGTDLRGGGVYIESGAALAFHGTENLIAYNRASYGGGIRLTAYSSIARAVIMSNTAGYGGGMAVYGDSGGVIANNIIAGNSATSRGSGLYFWLAQMEVTNNTLAGNLGGVGVAVEMDGATVPTLTNNIIVNHMVGIYNRSATVSPTLVTNDVWNGSVANYQGVLAGASDVHVDPLFVDPGGGNYHLASGSPVADVGTTVSWLATDFDGDQRPMGTGYDIGADETWPWQVFLPLALRNY